MEAWIRDWTQVGGQLTVSDGMKEGHPTPGIASKTIFRWIAAWFLDIIGVTFDTGFLRIALISTQEKIDAR